MTDGPGLLDALRAGWLPIALGFFVGAIPFGLLVSRAFFKRDIRSEGSGNIGAANALRTMGAKAGVAVLLLDAAKGAAAVLLALRLTPPGDTLLAAAVAALAGLAAIVGHCYSPYLRLRGGKGVATYLGATFALSWEAGLAFCLVWFAAAKPTGYASLGSILGTVAAAAALLAFDGGRYGAAGAVYALGSVALIVWKHRENLGRLRAGTESRLAILKR